MTTRRLAVALWSLAIVASVAWWVASYRYSAGFVWSNASPTPSPIGRRGLGRSDQGIALLSGVGKGIVYLSWDSAFNRSGTFFEPVNPHEFPHPWLGAQGENGRLWVSFPLGLVTGILALVAVLHLAKCRAAPSPAADEDLAEDPG